MVLFFRFPGSWFLSFFVFFILVPQFPNSSKFLIDLYTYISIYLYTYISIYVVLRVILGTKELNDVFRPLNKGFLKVPILVPILVPIFWHLSRNWFLR